MTEYPIPSLPGGKGWTYLRYGDTQPSGERGGPLTAERLVRNLENTQVQRETRRPPQRGRQNRTPDGKPSINREQAEY